MQRRLNLAPALVWLVALQLLATAAFPLLASAQAVSGPANHLRPVREAPVAKRAPLADPFNEVEAPARQPRPTEQAVGTGMANSVAAANPVQLTSNPFASRPVRAGQTSFGRGQPRDLHAPERFVPPNQLLLEGRTVGRTASRSRLPAPAAYAEESEVYQQIQRQPGMPKIRQVQAEMPVEEGQVIAGPDFGGGSYTSNGVPSEYYDEGAIEGDYYGDDCADGMCGDCFGGRCGRNGCCPRCLIPMPTFQTLEAFAGTHGFTNIGNRGAGGSFGFHEGVNWGLPFILGTSGQIGFQSTQNNLDGNLITRDQRVQSFVTIGLFRRVDMGLQGGLVYDYLHDDWDYSLDVTQLRGELSWLNGCGGEFGFWFNARGNRDTQVVSFPRLPTTTNNTAGTTVATFARTNTTFQATDVYSFFYRHKAACGGEGRVFGGWTNDQRGIMGANVFVPLNGWWGLQSDFTYLVPSNKSTRQFADESWNVSFNVVWSRRGNSRSGCNYDRPLFDVANNGSFLLRTNP